MWSQRQVLALCGISGMVGAALMFIGDLLLYGSDAWGSPAQTYFNTVDPIVSSAASLAASPMGASSRQRLIWGGALGPLAAVCYVAGCCQMLLASGGRWYGKVAFAGHVASFICVACYHSQYSYTGFIAQAADANDSAPLLWLVESHKAYMALLKDFIKLFGMVGSFGLACVCLSSQTPIYPRWLVLFSPGMWLMLLRESGLLMSLRAPFGMVIAGGSFNISYFVFFMVATAHLEVGEDSDSDDDKKNQ